MYNLTVPSQFERPEPRYQLFRLLGEPQRLKLLGLASVEELSVGELAELLHESQPNVSRHVNQLRQAGLLQDRHQGTRVFVRLAEPARADNVVADAIFEGQRLCAEHDCLKRIPNVIAARDLRSRAYFATTTTQDADTGSSDNVPVYALAISMVSSTRGGALDAGTGDGTLLDFLAPTYERVIAVDRSEVRTSFARQRMVTRGYSNVTVLCADVESADIGTTFEAKVDALYAVRMLHHTSNPRTTLAAFCQLLSRGGQVCIVNYMCHEDERMRGQRADVWMGFNERELAGLIEQAGFSSFVFRHVPGGYVMSGFDAHLPWFVATARKP